MAALELTIKALSQTDLELTLFELAARFRAGATEKAEAGERGVPSTLRDKIEAAAAGGSQARGRGGRKTAANGGPAGSSNLLGDVAAAAHPPAADDLQAEGVEAPAQPEDAGGGSAAGPRGADGGPMGSEEAPEAAAEAKASPAAASEETPPEAQTEVVVREDYTLEDVQQSSRELSAAKGIEVVRAVFAAHSVGKPKECPQEKFAAVIADMKKAMV